MREWNIIGDIHGQYDLLVQLAKVMPKAPFFSLGDMIDRGPKSLDVLRFFMEGENKALLGNHEHLMLNTYDPIRKIYNPRTWLDYRNGGFQTLLSFNPELMEVWREKANFDNDVTVDSLWKFIKPRRKTIFPKDVIDWVDSLPVFHEEPGLFLSHAPRSPYKSWADLMESKTEPMRLSGAPSNLLWNVRDEVQPIQGKVQIYGHIIYPKPMIYRDNDKKIYAMGIDVCRGISSGLVGVHWPSLEVYHVKGEFS